MTPHVSLRLFSALLLVAAWVLHSPPVAAQSSAATRPTPSLEERVDRLAAEIDRNRVDFHVPGAALAIVRGGQGDLRQRLRPRRRREADRDNESFRSWLAALDSN